MITAHGLTKNHGLQAVLRDVTFSVMSGERVGLIGPNGSGKTTLMRLLAGQDKPDEGHVALVPTGVRVGYLPQGFELPSELTLGQIMHETVGDLAGMEKDLAHLADGLAKQPDNPELQIGYDTLLADMSRLDVSRIRSIMSSLGLDGIGGEQLLGTLSGGQKTRLSLALVMLQDPQLLLLDEPSNHLDIQMMKWLEEWLLDFSGAALIISHDRMLLDKTVTHILDLDPETHSIRRYAGNYSDYLEQYLAEREKQLTEYKDQVYEIRRMRQDIQRTMEQARQVERTTTPRQPNVRRLAKKVARKAKSREKKLDRYLVSDERVEKPGQSWQMKLQLSGTPHLGKDVLTLEDLWVGYPGHAPLLGGINQQVQSGQRIVLTGPNGSGKSTLLRTIAGYLAPLRGVARMGASVRMGYLAQEQELLDSAMTPLETIQKVRAMNQTEARAFLHYFLFSGDDPLREIQRLSFGERVRLSLAVVVAQGCNLLLMDEPINHLDIPSREMFEQALNHFEGTTIAVVHDRYFISRFATDLWLAEERGLRVEMLRR